MSTFSPIIQIRIQQNSQLHHLRLLDYSVRFDMRNDYKKNKFCTKYTSENNLGGVFFVLSFGFSNSLSLLEDEGHHRSFTYIDCRSQRRGLPGELALNLS
jgi:hypothetical protein